MSTVNTAWPHGAQGQVGSCHGSWNEKTIVKQQGLLESRTLWDNGFSQKQGPTVTVGHHNGLLASVSPYCVYITNRVPQDPMVSLCSPVIHEAVRCHNGHLLPPRLDVSQWHRASIRLRFVTMGPWFHENPLCHNVLLSFMRP